MRAVRRWFWLAFCMACLLRVPFMSAWVARSEAALFWVVVAAAECRRRVEDGRL